MKNLVVERWVGPRVQDEPLEIVERKGRGHPDSLCDGAAEEVSIALSRQYLAVANRILHHNVDKAVLIGGEATVSFGGGHVVRPMRLVIAGRAVPEFGGKALPIGDVAREAIRAYFHRTLPNLDVARHLEIEIAVRRGHAGLEHTVSSATPLANDTSLAVGYAPLSPLERVVHVVEDTLNGAAWKERHPETGEDVKVMGVRRSHAIQLTIAQAMVAGRLTSAASYEATREEVRREASNIAHAIAGTEAEVDVNAADEPSRGLYYLTVTGTSAEQGDDGQVGRGNRVNGLITPYRPMTLEAVCGKNPVSHVGKLYSVAAHVIASRCAETPGIVEAMAYLVSQIGSPITEPQAVHVKLRSSLGDRENQEIAERIVAEVLTGLPDAWRGYVERRLPLH